MALEANAETHEIRAADKAVKFWDARKPSEYVDLKHQHTKLITNFRSSAVNSFSALEDDANNFMSSPRGDDKASAPRLVTASLDGMVKLSSLEKSLMSDSNQASQQASPRAQGFDAAAPGTEATLVASDDYVLCVDFDDTRLVVGGVDGNLYVYDFESEHLLKKNTKSLNMGSTAKGDVLDKAREAGPNCDNLFSPPPRSRTLPQQGSSSATGFGNKNTASLSSVKAADDKAKAEAKAVAKRRLKSVGAYDNPLRIKQKEKVEED